ncbi:Bug family tripartite tricarboxylate transporter substrate binding protein [Roseococcus sp. YIM B11640]|uniref:Bug family tripartite tricarboxylate transporter substrate binding protein n=1 Tax=Roseococcus sp. YIM B11640 TaxID=3133973 RepID=UPI003C7C154E
MLLAAALLAPLGASGQSWPERPVRMIVPFPPGGGTEAIGRLVAQHYQEVFGQPFVVESRSGASGLLGTEMTARAAPDGYTISMTASGPLTILPQMMQAGYDPVRSFEHVYLPSITPLLMVMPNNRAPNSIAEFVPWAQARRGQINYCSIGVASPSHLSAEMFARATGVEMTHVPHRGSGPALLDVIAGHCDVLFDSMTSSSAHVRAGRLKALGVSTRERLASWPEMPTIAEQGVAGYVTQTWSAIVAPAGTPAAIVARLNEEGRRFSAGQRERERTIAQGGLPVDLSPTQFREFLQTEIAAWGEVIRAGNIKVD